VILDADGVTDGLVRIVRPAHGVEHGRGVLRDSVRVGIRPSSFRSQRLMVTCGFRVRRVDRLEICVMRRTFCRRHRSFFRLLMPTRGVEMLARCANVLVDHIVIHRRVARRVSLRVMMKGRQMIERVRVMNRGQMMVRLHRASSRLLPERGNTHREHGQSGRSDELRQERTNLHIRPPIV
jgi:hypothetical protein